MRTCSICKPLFTKLAAAATLAVGLVACTTLTANSADSWREEVLLHDGQKIVVERSQTYKGRSEPAQGAPIGEHTIRFNLPGSGKPVAWTSDYGEDIGRTNFNLLALHVLNGTPYVVASPNLCLAYNKWGRPNPPYVVFKQDGANWQRIGLDALPMEFKTINVTLSIQKPQAKQLSEAGLVDAEMRMKMDGFVGQPEFKTILKAALPPERLCPQYSGGPKAPAPILTNPVAK
jgi:hypothetical protein